MKSVLFFLGCIPLFLLGQTTPDSIHPLPVDTLFQNGMTEYQKREWESAESLFVQVLEHSQVGTEMLAETHYILGKSIQRQGNYGRSLPHYQQALELFRNFQEPRLRLRGADVGKYLGQVYMRHGDYERALYLFRQAIATIQTYEGKRDQLVYNYLEIANSYYKMGNTAMAISNLKHAERIVGISPAAQAFIAYYQGSFLPESQAQEAIVQFNKALDYFEKSAPNQYQMACLATLATLHLEIDDSEQGQKEAQGFLEQAFELVPQVYDNPHRREVANLYLTQGQILQLQRAYSEALQAFQTGLYQLFPEQVDTSDVSQVLPDSLFGKENHILRCLRGKAECFLALGENEDALQHYRTMVLAEEELGSGNRYESAQYLLLEDQRESLGKAMRLAATPRTPPDWGYFFAERAKSRILNQAIQQSFWESSNLPERLKRKSQEMADNIAAAESELGGLDAGSPELDSLRFEQAILKDTIQNYRARREENEAKIAMAELAAIQKNLSPDQLLIHYVVEDAPYALAISASQSMTYALEATDSALLLFPTLLNQPPQSGDIAGIQTFSKPAHQLYQAILAPILADFPDHNRLLVIPDEALFRIPFEALLTAEPDWKNWPEELAAEQFWKGKQRVPEWGAAYLMLDYEVQYAFSASSWFMAQQSQQTENQDFLAYAPSYAISDSFRGLRLAPLPSALPHAERVAEQFGSDGTTIESQGASHFLAHASSAGYLHLAMHSFVDREHPLRSTLAFGRESEQQNGMIIAANIYAMDPMVANMVSLLACKSGDGKQVSGEGVLSLGRAFRIAGAKSVLMSVWDADARLGGMMLEEMYKGLLSGKSSSQALQSAKISYLEQATAYEAHPSHWASYVLFGADHSLKRQSGFPWWWGLLTGIAILLGFYLARKIKGTD